MHQMSSPCVEWEGSKLSVEDIIQMKAMVTNGYTQKEAAEVFEVDPSTVSKVVNGKTWSHL